MTRNELLDYALFCDGNIQKMLQMMKKNEKAPSSEYDGDYITILDEAYPQELLELSVPPLVLFYKGDISLLKGDKISVVGSRIPSRYGCNVTKEICSILSQKATLISGMAKGIDALVHSSCIPFAKTIGVLGCGIDVIYPKENRSLFREMALTQLIISEYPANVKPEKYHFPVRNRIIAALGNSLVVTEAGMKSGTFLTVNEALGLNKDIYVVPYPLLGEMSGCNYLIQQGANILADFSDVKKILNFIDKK